MKLSNKDAVNKYHKTPDGWLTATYQAMKHNASLGGVAPPDFTKQEYREFVFANDFARLYIGWRESAFNKWLRPSPDRIDSKQGYKLTNIRLVIWRENYMARDMSKTRWKKSKLTPKDIVAIRSRISNGEVGRHLASEYGVSPFAIYNITSGRSWADITCG